MPIDMVAEVSLAGLSFRAALEAANAAGQTVYLRTQLLPGRYVAFETSGLAAEIEAGRDNLVTLDLSSAPDASP
jgi:hypothetical protein